MVPTSLFLQGVIETLATVSDAALPVTHFGFVPSTLDLFAFGPPDSVTVQALDENDDVVTTYAGPATFESVPSGLDLTPLTWVDGELGLSIGPNDAGTFHVVVTDDGDPGITGNLPVDVT